MEGYFSILEVSVIAIENDFGDIVFFFFFYLETRAEN